MLVARDERPASRPLDRPLRSADVDHHRVLHQDPGQAGVAGPALDCLGGDREGELRLRARCTDQVEERLDRARDLQLDFRPGGGQLDQRVGPALGRVAVVVGARLACEGLERVAHHRATNRVEATGEEEAAVVLGVEVEEVALRQLGLLRGNDLGLDRVPVVQTPVMELARRALPRQLEQLLLVESFAHGIGRPRHRGEVGEADLA